MAAFCALDKITPHREGLGDAHSLLAVFRGEQSISAAHGQAICFPACGHPYNFYVKVQVSHHAANDSPLLVILLAKDGDIWLYNIEQLGHNLQHTEQAASQEPQ